MQGSFCAAFLVISVHIRETLFEVSCDAFAHNPNAVDRVYQGLGIALEYVSDSHEHEFTLAKEQMFVYIDGQEKALSAQ